MDKGERPRGWRTDAEARAASGGHISSELGAELGSGGPLFDALDAPLPSEIERERPPDPIGPTSTVEEVVPGPRTAIGRAAERGRKATRTSAPRGGPKRRPATRKVKRTLRPVDPLSVLKLSLVYYSFLLVLWLGVVAILFTFVNSLGFFESLEDIGQDLVLWDRVEISLGLVERWAFLLGLAGVVIGSLLNVFLAFLYNLVSDLVGGVEVTFVERDLG